MLKTVSGVSFTGTQKGMTDAQHTTLRTVLNLLRLMTSRFIHGDCIGSDYEADAIAKSLDYCVEIWPANGAKRAHCSGELIHEPQPPLNRNNDIVANGSILVATPKEHSEVKRSGTWATIRIARWAAIPVVIITPSGTIVTERNSKPA